ncbi:Potassium voltage-gated channel subfamily H member 7 [Porphyridium purpureum]|uniref:Potassium voltage-gated channel subfamily H member 7 n=1 Tax=Porphyridium purpureum TaxID=35688 RepID=A0A5J4Z7J7_PORPP|nr:Potassium voltage-gated channel subfamily H member 7 [Porphyridium purpureum]|eukprot:POR2903..scf295_1
MREYRSHSAEVSPHNADADENEMARRAKGSQGGSPRTPKHIHLPRKMPRVTSGKGASRAANSVHKVISGTRSATSEDGLNDTANALSASMSMTVEDEMQLKEDREALSQAVNSGFMSLEFSQKRGKEDERKHQWFFIDPSSPFRRMWDLYILMWLLYVATVLVYLTCFIPDSSDSVSSAWFWVERGLDVSFLLDIVFNFCTGFFGPNRILVTDPKRIALKYLTTWFIVDLVSTIPWGLVSLAYSDPSQPEWIELLRFLKLLRLLKLGVLLDSFRLLDPITRLEVRFRVKYARRKMIVVVMFAALLAHWIACLFYFFAALQGPGSVTWISVDVRETNPTNLQLYIYALYFSIYTITTIGYGDVTPESTLTRGYTIFAMALGAAMFALVISLFSSLVTELSVNEIFFRSLMDQVSAYARLRHFPPELHVEIRKYFLHKKRYNGLIGETDLLDALTPELRGKAILYSFQGFADKTYFLSGLSEETLANVFGSAERVSYTVNELIFQVGEPANNLYLLERGCVEVLDANGSKSTLRGGSVLGEHGIYLHHKRKVSAVCRTCCDCVRIPADTIHRLLELNAAKKDEVLRKEVLLLWKASMDLARSKARLHRLSSHMRILADIRKEYSTYEEFAANIAQRVAAHEAEMRELERKLKLESAENQLAQSRNIFRPTSFLAKKPAKDASQTEDAEQAGNGARMNMKSVDEMTLSDMKSLLEEMNIALREVIETVGNAKVD